MFFKTQSIGYNENRKPKSRGEKAMFQNNGKIRFVIAPTKNNGDYLFCLLKEKFPSSYLYFDGYFIYLTTYAFNSYSFLKKIQEIEEVKSVFLDEEIIPQRNEQKKCIGKEKTENKTNVIDAKIHIKPVLGTNRTQLFEALYSSFPDNQITMTDNYLILTGKTKKISDLILRIQSIHGVEYARFV